MKQANLVVRNNLSGPELQNFLEEDPRPHILSSVSIGVLMKLKDTFQVYFVFRDRMLGLEG